MAATLKALGEERDVARRIAVLGPMRELGADGADAHAALAPAVLGAKIDQLILVGDDMRRWPMRSRRALPIERADDAEDAAGCSRASSARATWCWSRRAIRSGLRGWSKRWQGVRHALPDRRAVGLSRLLNLIRYISFRAGGASATAMLIGLLMGPSFIRWLRARQGKGQPIRADGPQSHLAKRGTPTMGGLLILIALFISTLLWMDVYSPYVWACLLVTGGFGLIGFLDDYDKVKKAHHAGLSGKMRLFLEFAIAGFATWLMVRVGGTQLYLPFVQGPVLDLAGSTSRSGRS